MSKMKVSEKNIVGNGSLKNSYMAIILIRDSPEHGACVVKLLHIYVDVDQVLRGN
jgi:hypothetical protein